MDNFELVSSLHSLPETNSVDNDGIQFGPTCQNVQATGSGDCLVLTMVVNSTVDGAFQTLVAGIGIGIGIGGANTSVGC